MATQSPKAKGMGWVPLAFLSNFFQRRGKDEKAKSAIAQDKQAA
jgi:hypothetical protein